MNRPAPTPSGMLEAVAPSAESRADRFEKQGVKEGRRLQGATPMDKQFPAQGRMGGEDLDPRVQDTSLIRLCMAQVSHWPPYVRRRSHLLSPLASTMISINLRVHNLIIQKIYYANNYMGKFCTYNE